MSLKNIKGRYKFWSLILLPIYLWIWYICISNDILRVLSAKRIENPLDVFIAVWVTVNSLFIVGAVIGNLIKYIPQINNWADEKF